jgi:hypothetical protein
MSNEFVDISEYLTEKDNSVGRIYRYEVKVKIDSVILTTVVHAENIDRAWKIAKKLYGNNNVISKPTRS